MPDQSQIPTLGHSFSWSTVKRPRKRLKKNGDKLAIIQASKSARFDKEEAMKKRGVKKTQLHDLLKNKHLLETKLAESPVRSAKHVLQSMFSSPKSFGKQFSYYFLVCQLQLGNQNSLEQAYFFTNFC